MKEVTSAKTTGEEGTIVATTNSLSNKELEGISIQILQMYNSACIAYGKQKTN